VKRFLLDVNVVLDVLLDREPHAAAACALWGALEIRGKSGVVAAHGVTTVHYLLARKLGRVKAGWAIERLLSIFAVAPVDAAVLRAAMALDWPDFEDAVTASAGAAARCQAIVTRDARGFREPPLPAVDAAAALAWLEGP
jgi:predicted nucleic acid-binding protein